MRRRFLGVLALVGAIAVLTTGCTAVIVGGGNDPANADAGADHGTRDTVADAIWPDTDAGHRPEGHRGPHEGAHRAGPPHV
jgi:hypothetical protein